MKDNTLIDLKQIESSKDIHSNLYEQLEFGRFNSVKSGAAPTIYHEFIAGDEEYEFTMAQGTYTMGDHSLQVFVNGQLMRVGEDNDYIEATSRSIHFNFGLEKDDIVVLRVNGGTSGPLLHENIRAEEGQTEVTLAGSYEAGNNSLKIFINGAYQTLGVDYLEVDAKTILFTEPLEHQDLVTFRVEGLPTVTQKYVNSITSRLYNSNKQLIKEEYVGDGVRVVKEYEYNVDGFPLRMTIREAGYLIIRTYEWNDTVCIAIHEEVKEGL